MSFDIAYPTYPASRRERVTALHSPGYIGRFAPSPSGPLHLGSLVCALASYLDAKAHQGLWLVRMEDIDPPREQAGAAADILHTLEAYGLHWDGPVVYQSERAPAYDHCLAWLAQHQLTYPCACTRKRLQKLGGVYDGYCRRHPPDGKQACARRLAIAHPSPDRPGTGATVRFDDCFLGSQVEDLGKTSGDFVIHRKDGLYAYQLAVVVDDLSQGITHVVRGQDLLETTAKQIYLHQMLGHPSPVYGHIPLVLDKHGNKLSKQNHAAPVPRNQIAQNLALAFEHLGLPSPIAEAFCDGDRDFCARLWRQHWCQQKRYR